MLTISPGAIVTCPSRTGAQLWIAKEPAPPSQWRLLSKRTNQMGLQCRTSLTVGHGDIVVVKSAPNFTAGQVIEHEGQSYEVIIDLGSDIEVLVPSHSHPLQDGTVHIPGGNHLTIPKSEIVIGLLK